MGGSGGSTYSDYVGRGGQASGASCALLGFEAAVNSPDPDVVRVLTVGTLCEILLEGAPAQLRVYLRQSGALLGAITERWPELSGCIADGFRYEAEVITLFPAVRVRVQPRTTYELPVPFRAHIDATVALTAAGSYELTLGFDRKVIATADGNPVGTIPEEPAALPDAVEIQRATIAVVTDPVTGAVEVRKG
ncbi:hypothetical protein [Cellulosimicrobium cellulans]|uniref:hypothetical protein n=1 Tax=Cellulosimicrobium cellulans TaxID=1710 RepID=UPI00130D813F|nr:hypothetical protein [Cellulosimicrobium cellulans]